MMRGRIIKGIGGFYEVLCDGQIYTCRARGRFRKEKLTPLIGDWVSFTPGMHRPAGGSLGRAGNAVSDQPCAASGQPNEGEELGAVDAIEPRRNALKRPPLANLDLLLCVCAAKSPAPDLLLVDKLLLQAKQIDCDVVLVLNKCDLADQDALQALTRQYTGAVRAVYPVSAARGDGLEALRAGISGLCCCLAGQSGVGKSSLLNALFPQLGLVTGEVSQRMDRGKHTTRHVELLMLEGGGAVADTPGFSLLEMESLEPRLLPALYPEFKAYEGKCRFNGCLHQSEPGCAVKDAVAQGAISQERWQRYGELLQELKERWRDRYD